MPRLHLNQLECDQTTEYGEDEVYILVAQQSEIFGPEREGPIVTNKKYRLPSDASHWDMNDGVGDSNHIIYNVDLLSGGVAKRQQVSAVIVVMEEDGGTSKPYQEMLAELLEQTDNPITTTAGYILELLTKFGLYAVDSDDYIGSFAMTMYSDLQGHNLYSRWSPIDRISVSQPRNDIGPNAWEFRMNGDGSNYQFIANLLDGMDTSSLGSRPAFIPSIRKIA
jgi:hypothetical protein